MATVLVTGACGLIGDKVCSGLLKKGNMVIAVDSAPSEYNAGKANYKFYQASPNEKDKYIQIFDDEQITQVVHLACSVDNDFGPIVTEKEMSMSKQFDKYFYKLVVSHDVEKMLVLSTSQVYLVPDGREPIREDDDLKPISNYAKMKSDMERAFAGDVKHMKNMICAVMRAAPIYSLEFMENLRVKITDPKDKTCFVYRTGEYGFQFCCLHNLVDFILCFLRQADTRTYTGVYNVADKNLIMASEIISFIRENGRLGAVIQRNPPKEGLAFLRKFGGNKEEKTDYRYLDFSHILSNTMLDCSKASHLCPFRWNIENTK